MYFRRVTGATRQPLLIDSNVATVAILISYGVANLTLKVTHVLLVLGITFGVGPDILVAVFALCRFWILIPGIHRSAALHL